MASARKAVLGFGLRGVTPGMTTDPSLAQWTPEVVGKIAKEQVEQLQQEGIDVTSWFFEPADSRADVNTHISELYNSQHWDVVLVGGGVRLIPDFKDQFQDIINLLVAKGQSPPPSIVFPNRPDELYERIKGGLSG